MVETASSSLCTRGREGLTGAALLPSSLLSASSSLSSDSLRRQRSDDARLAARGTLSALRRLTRGLRCTSSTEESLTVAKAAAGYFAWGLLLRGDVLSPADPSGTQKRPTVIRFATPP